MHLETGGQVAKNLIGGETVIATTHDPAEFELALQPWELLCRPQGKGGFRHHITAIKYRKFVLYRERYNLQIELQGLSPDGMMGICIPLDFHQGPVVWGKQYAREAIPATIPGPVDAMLGSGYGQLIALISIDHLRQAIPHGDYERLESAARSRVLQLSPRLIGAFSRWGNQYLDSVESCTARFENPALFEDIFFELVDFLLQVSACVSPPRPRSNLATRQRGLLRAIDYLRYRLDRRTSVTELCRVARVSERSLQYAFRDEFGISPTEFMRKRRLHAVRRMLTASSAEDSSVSKIALDYGFTELGRFAVDYRGLFGVHPSETLKSGGNVTSRSKGKPAI